MKFSYRFLFVTAFCQIFLAFSQAEILFQEDFESSVYELDLPVPVDFGVIAHGKWNGIPPQSRPGVVILEDGNRVLELKSVSGFARGARVIGAFGKTNQEETVTSDKLRFSFRFKISAPLQEAYFQVGGGDGRAKATLGMNEEGMLTASFAGDRSPLGGILDAGKWYYVEIILPSNPRTNSHYQVILYEDASRNELDRASGRLARSIQDGENNYKFFDIQHQTPNEYLLIDDIVAETIPE